MTNTVTFYKVVALPVDLDKARAQYRNPDLDFTPEERTKLLALVDLLEQQELGKAIEAYRALNRDEREYLMIDMYEVLEQLGMLGANIYLDEPKTGQDFISVG